MKKLIFSVMALFCAMMTMAQPVPTAVEPGTKGALPQVPVIDKTVPENLFVGLELDRVTYSSSYYEVWLKFPIAADLGGEYYTVEYAVDGKWETYSYYGDAVHFTYDNATLPYGDSPTYRLRMHGGDKDGFVSNTISVMPQLSNYETSVGGTAVTGNDRFVLVGREQMKNFTFGVTVRLGGGKKEEYFNDSEYIRYQWYRRNPYNYDMTAIDGATKQTYTPTLDDAGYELVVEASGDGEHCGFIICKSLKTVVSVPVTSSTSYYGPDGVILNTDYVLSDPAKQLVYLENSLGEPQPLPATIVTKKPGQYAIVCPDSIYMRWYETDLAGDAYRLTFHYQDGDVLMIREVQLGLPAYRLRAPLMVNTVLDGSPVQATVDVLGPDINGNIVVKATATTDENGTVTFNKDLYTLGDGYYVRARAAGQTDVYYPGVSSMAQATLVKPGRDEERTPVAITIDLKGGGTAKKGDVNGDSAVNVADIATVIDVMAGVVVGPVSARADVNGDGAVNVADIAAIIDIMAGVSVQ